MIIGIDASNLRGGGGVTHLTELLRAAQPYQHGITKIIVWSGIKTLTQIEDRVWLEKVHDILLDGPLLYRVYWQRFRLKRVAEAAGCDLLFVPGGSDVSGFRPMVTMSQNLLPFEWEELRRYGCSVGSLRLILLHWTQARTFRRADGLIYLTRFARDVVLRTIQATAGKTAIIAHGVDKRFIYPPRKPMPISYFSTERPCRILYVSTVNAYKHQWHVAEAVSQLRAEGVPVALDLVGASYPPALRRLEKTLRRVDVDGAFIRYVGRIPYQSLHEYYLQADLSVFASSCETFGLILTESMSAGLPIACSKRSAMPEILGEAGVYFDPEDSDDIARALRELIDSADLRARLAQASFERSKAFSWERCARETFAFLAEIADRKAARQEQLLAEAAAKGGSRR